jgi:uncharacterized protein YceK
MKKRLLVSFITLALLSGCASIIDGANQNMTFRTEPEAATVSITNKAGEKIHQGATPLTLSLKRGAGYFQSESYQVRFEKTGFKSTMVTINGGVNGWYFGNILVGGLIGMLIVDPLTGAMYRLAPDDLNAALEGDGKASMKDGDLLIVMKQNVSPKAMKAATLISAK